MDQVRWLSVACVAVAVLSACTNLARAPAALKNTSNGSASGGSGSELNSGNFILLTVLPSQQSAGTQYDMIGTGSQFNTYCGQSLNDCRCEYTYASGSATETINATPTYVESDLIRCPNSVPSGVASFTVRVITTDGGYFSTGVRVDLSQGTFAGSTFYIDLAKEESYLQVRRFQCKKREFIANPLDSAMIDPIQSEDPRVIYPFNFYTTNVSESLLQMQRLGNQNWECTLLETKNRTLHSWANPMVFSASSCTSSFCSSEGELMYPDSSLISGKIPVSNLTSVGKKRASFWLAKQAYGVFQIPVRAAIAPKDYVSSTYGVIGYAARPIPSQAGTSVCPSISIPSNAAWVKLWNFRATDITPPKKVTSTYAATLSAIACNPSDTSFFPSCKDWALSSTIAAPGATGLASRVVVIDSNVGTAHACYHVNTSSWGSPESETWNPGEVLFGDPSNGGATVAQVKSLPWGMYSQLTGIGFSGGIARATPAPMPAATPSDHQVTSVALSQDNYTDQIFVVSESAVEDSAMRNQSSSVSQYRPVTYRTRVSCSASPRSGCNTSKEIHWDINVKEVGNPTGGDQYPLCVLQFYD